VNPDLWGGVLLVGLGLLMVGSELVPAGSWLGRALASLSDTCEDRER
jgi:hypothetical protein